MWADGVLGDGSDVEEGKLKATRALAYWIRRYRPDVVVTHDFDGEYGHKNHQATAWACTWAVPMAADPAADPDADDDHDGLDNHYEFVAGLDPHAQDRTDFTIAGDGSSVDFTVPGTTGVTGYEGLTRRYQLLHSPDMVDWSTVVAEGIADGTPLTYPIPGGQARGFYRLVLSIE